MKRKNENNLTDDLSLIKDKKIKIRNKKLILSYISDYGFHKMINCYGDIIKSLVKKYSTNDIVNLFKLDKWMSSEIRSYILDFEQQLNTKAIKQILKYNNLPSDYCLNITNNPAFSNLRNKGYKDFANEIYDNASFYNCLWMYDNPKTIPLKNLSLSWSFHTLISFIDLQDIKTKNRVVGEFNINPEDTANFISVCHSIRKIRNVVSHNDIFLVTRLSYYRREFNIILNNKFEKNFDINTDINVYKLLLALEIVLNKKITDRFLRQIKEFELRKKVTKGILDLMGF